LIKYVIVSDKLEDCQQETTGKAIRIDQKTRGRW